MFVWYVCFHGRDNVDCCLVHCCAQVVTKVPEKYVAYPEDGGDKFLRNDGNHLQMHMAL
jgi:hypothetical protein